MQAVSMRGLVASAVCLLLVACHGSNSTPSTIPPTVGTFTWPAPTSSTAGISVTFTDTGASTSDGSSPNYSWSFGDQTPTGSTQATTGNPVTHIYAQPGVYLVTLSVSDDHGTTASQAKTVNVTGTPVSVDGVENWAWVSGSKYANSSGDYQTLLQPSASNQPSGRQNAATWTTAAIIGHPVGQLWLMGGYGYDSTGATGVLNDIWSFDPSTQQWTWVGGSNKANAPGIWPASYGASGSAPTNVVSARSAVAQWTDSQGNFWLFGGNGFDKSGTSSYLNDMWKLDKLTGEATWEAGNAYGNEMATAGTQGVAGTGNYPGNRAFATTWVDKNGIFWLFGGQGFNSSGNVDSYSDLWCYDPNPQNTTNHPNGQLGWMWVSGSTNSSNASGNYGTQGTAAKTNLPGARVNAQSWVDSKTGNLWLFGGDGYDSAGSYGALNDLWMYNTTTGMWTWVAGANLEGANSVYGTEGHSTPASGTFNTPGGRVGTVGWVDSSDNLWLFGGSGSDSTSTTSANDGGGALNELWTFNTSTYAWTWMGGVSVEDTAGVYLTQYPSLVGSKYNSPGSRVWGSSWIDNSNNFWMYGGSGVDSTGTSGYLNDLWTIQLTVPPVP